MNFQTFKKEMESFPQTSVSLTGHLVNISFPNGWSRFPIDRTDKMKAWLNNLRWMNRVAPDKDSVPTIPQVKKSHQFKLF